MRPGNGKSKDPEYFIPRVKDLLTKVWGMEVFTELDLANAYHQIKLHPDSRKYSGFYFPGEGQFIWNVLFFGVKGAVTHFQRVMEEALSDVPSHIVVVIYVDNILMASKEVKTHKDDIEVVIKALNKANLRLKPSKCKIAMEAIQFMGIIVDRRRRGVDAFKAKAFQEMKAPTSGKEVQAVLGFVNFLRDFIPLYASLAAPLEKLRNTKKISAELWKESGAEEAFEKLKVILSNAPILHAPDFSKRFVMESDASQFGVGVVLFQEVGKVKRYIDFAAKALTGGQINYPAAKRELLAGLFGMKRWRNWLLFRKFTWGMDNSAMTYINESTNRMVLNWVHIFSEFDFDTVFKRGILNILPHNLSHMYGLMDDLDFGRKEKSKEKVDVSEGIAMRVAGVGSKYKISKERYLWECEEKNHLEDDLEKRKELLNQRHVENHGGVSILFQTMWVDSYWWDTMWEECIKTVKGCKTCMLFNVGRGGFHPMRTLCAAMPMDHVLMDFAGPFKVGKKGELYIFILVDVHSRFCFLQVLKGKVAVLTVYACMAVFANFGVPKILQSDNDTSFVNEVIKEFSKMAGFEHCCIMAYFPRTNGVVEKWVGETKLLLKKWCEGNMENWPDLVPAIQKALNDKISSRTKSCPFDVMFGRRMNGFEDYRLHEETAPLNKREMEKLRREWIRKMDELANDIWPLILKVGKEAGEKRCARGNEEGRRQPKKKTLEVGQLVLKRVAPKRGGSRKWEGPYEIVEFEKKKRGYKLKEVLGKKRLLKGHVPIERLKECTEAFSLEEDDGLRYEVEFIKSHGKADDGTFVYLVKWKDYDDKESTWEKAWALENKTILEYWMDQDKSLEYARARVKEVRDMEKELD